MSRTARVRWHRHGAGRLFAAVFVSLLAAAALMLAVGGIGRPVNWVQVAGGAVAFAALAWWACLPLRAGIGVAPEHVLVREATGRTTRIPWADVTGFEAAKIPDSSNEGLVVYVLTADGKRWHTLGYSPGSSPWDAWYLMRDLEDERLARTPGTASTLPPRPAGPEEVSLTVPVLIIAGVIGLVVLGSAALASGRSDLGPGLRAASHGGAAGYFIPREEQCYRQRCTWTGDFRRADGTVTLVEASIAETDQSGFRAGVPVPAVDAGDARQVYPPRDPGAWHDAAYALILGTWSWAVLLFLALRPMLRRLAAADRKRLVTG